MGKIPPQAKRVFEGIVFDVYQWEQVLLDGKTEVKPSFVQNERTALRGEDGRYAARCLYVFPAARLDPRGRFTLVIRDPDEKEMSKFTVDLSAMR